MKKIRVIILFFFMPIFCVQAQTPFYEGKSIRIIVGGTAGGGLDVYSRAIARRMAKHIPGNPTLIVENKAGAATQIAAKYLYSGTKPDGLTFGIFSGSLILGRVIGSKEIDFDVRKFEWLGVPVQDNVVCALHKTSGVRKFQEWIESKTPVKFGALGPGNSTSDVPRVLKAALGLPIQVVEGYKGTADVRLAAEAGEVGGGCWAWESVKVTWSKGLQSRDVIVGLQVTSRPLVDLPDVPSALEQAKTDEGRLLIQYGAIAPSIITRVYVMPPGSPRDKTQILRRAFQDTLRDPEFLAEAAKAKLEVNPLTGEEVERIVNEMFNIPSSVVSRLSLILAVK
jgi:tripartite-type tricarboxylate transporter receptor subunit TctC